MEAGDLMNETTTWITGWCTTFTTSINQYTFLSAYIITTKTCDEREREQHHNNRKWRRILF